MRRYISVLLFVMMLACEAFGIHSGEQAKRKQYIEIPREIALPVIAIQPGCPVQFERVRLLIETSGRAAEALTLYNRGTKPISGVTYAMRTSNGGGWMSSWPKRLIELRIMPGEMIPLDGEAEVIVPLTDQLRDKFKLRGSMQMIAVFMIVKVEFTDGSVYEDKETLQALESYLQNLAAVHSQ